MTKEAALSSPESAMVYLVEEISTLREETAVLRQENKKILDRLGPEEPWTMIDCAEYQGCSPSSLYRCPWKVPGYGKADFGEGVKRWKPETARAFYSIPEAERKETWDRMSAEEKRECLGVRDEA